MNSIVLHNLMNPAIGGTLLLLLACIVYFFYSSIVHLQKIKYLDIIQAQEMATRSRSARSMIAALVIVDIVVGYYFVNAVSAQEPLGGLIAAILFVNIFFLYIILWLYFASYLARKRIRKLVAEE